MIGPTNALTVTGTVDPGSVTVGSNLKPVKLVNGVATAVDNDLVDTASTQDIRGNKIFYDRPTFDYWNPVLRLNAGHAIGFNVQLNVDEYNVAPGADKVYSQTVFDKNNVQEAKLQYFHGTSGTKDWRLHVTKNDGIDIYAELLRSLPDGTTYSTSPWRGSENYPSMGTDEVITRGALQASTDVVHRSGDETIDGVKTFTSLMKGRFDRDVYTRGSKYTLLYKRTASRQQWWFGFGGHTMIIANVQSDSKINTRVISLTDRPYPQPIMMVCTDSKGVVTVWGKAQYFATVQWHLMSNMLYGTDYTDGMEIIGTEYSSAPTVGGTTQYDSEATYTSVINSTDFDYVR